MDLTADDISGLTEGALRGIVGKLNDAANKRLRRLENTGLEMFSPSYRARKKESGLSTFTIEPGDTVGTLKRKYLQARQFLRQEGYSTKAEIIKHIAEDNAPIIKKVLGKTLDDPSNWDKRYKKKQVLKKSVKKKLTDFWTKYHQWREIEERNNPSKEAGGTNTDDVEEFAEDLYQKGKTDIQDYERKAQEDYEQAQREQMTDEDDALQPGTSYGKAAGTPKRAKRTKKGTIKERFEKIKIF
jgi:hypothetical protein